MIVKNITGLGASIGIAIGNSYIYENEVDFDIEVKFSYKEANENLIENFKKQSEEFQALARQDEADVLEAYILILQDPEITGQISEEISTDAQKIFQVFQSTADIFNSMDDDYFKQRAEDIGIILKEGGFTSHAVIVAKNLGIPCVIGIKDLLDDIESNTSIAIDGDSGQVLVNPSKEDKDTLLNKHEEHQKIINSFTKEAYEKLGLNFRVNIGSTDQKDVINSIGKKFNGTIVYRTLDIGGDKQVSYLNLPVEENPFLGVRGIRLSLANEDIFTSQVKSILTSECVDQIKIMFPMISTVSDFLEAKSFVENIATELNVSMPQLGIMVETPSSVFLVDKFAEVVDFISIGTNDLTQYIMAADRGNTQLSHYQDPLSPAVIRAISKVIDVGREHNIEVSVCGEMASDPVAAFGLYILGLKTFSMSPNAAPFVFHTITKNHDIDRDSLKETILNANNYLEVREILQKETQ
jgi:phosphoenolpyruvate-protein kinase (PTS system EI component)